MGVLRRALKQYRREQFGYNVNLLLLVPATSVVVTDRQQHDYLFGAEKNYSIPYAATRVAQKVAAYQVAKAGLF